MLDIEQIIYVSIFHQESIMEIDQSNIEVASGAIVPSKCGELAFRVVKKVSSETGTRLLELNIYISKRKLPKQIDLFWTFIILHFDRISKTIFVADLY